MANKRIDEPTGIETVGHEWDGIEELNNPLPRWWVTTFWLCVVFSIGYMVVYPAIPLLKSGTEGMWGWSSRGQLAAEMDKAATERKPVLDAIAATSLDAILADPKMLDQAKAGGKAAFKQNCVQCHGELGDGRGTAASALAIAPTDFTQQRPTLSRSVDVLRRGVAGTPMVPWTSRLSEAEVVAVAQFVRTFYTGDNGTARP